MIRLHSWFALLQYLHYLEEGYSELTRSGQAPITVVSLGWTVTGHLPGDCVGGHHQGHQLAHPVTHGQQE